MDAVTVLNPWQRDSPLVRAPYAAMGAALGLSEGALLERLRGYTQQGSLSRIGGHFAASAGGAALLAAMAVPPARLDAVAHTVSAQPGVNHNYAREHAVNLWFVVTGWCADHCEAQIAAIEAATGIAVLRLPMVRPYRIDLGFCLHGGGAPRGGHGYGARAPAVAEAELPLAARVEDGLALVPRPYDAWAEALGWTPDAVLATLQRWLAAGTLRRLGCIVRHHELGWASNAMAVFDVPDDAVDAAGRLLAGCDGVTLAYRRQRHGRWPYNLYAMVHGQGRAQVLARLDAAASAAGLAQRPRAALFSTHRYKQTGARRFRDHPLVLEAHDAAASR